MEKRHDWPEQGPNALATVSCHICGAIVGLKWGTAPNPTDGVAKHAAWHETLAGDGCNDAAGSKVAQVRSGLDLPDQSQSNSVREAND